jgi:hypothetical protein
VLILNAIGWILLAQVVGAPLLLTRYVLGQPKRVLFERLTRGGSRMRETFDITFICGHTVAITSPVPPIDLYQGSRTTVCDDCARKLREIERSKTVTEAKAN